MCQHLQVFRLDPVGPVEPGEGSGDADRLALAAVAGLDAFLVQLAEDRLCSLACLVGPGQSPGPFVGPIDLVWRDRGAEGRSEILAPEQTVPPP